MDDTADDTAGSAGDLDWKDVKQNLKANGSPACDKERRTGSWADISCREEELTSTVEYTPEERWRAGDCNSAWNNTMFRWRNCDRPLENVSFSASISNFLHANENPGCSLIVDHNNCNSRECVAHNDELTAPKNKVGAGAYLIWNALVEVHAVRSYPVFLSSAVHSQTPFHLYWTAD